MTVAGGMSVGAGTSFTSGPWLTGGGGQPVVPVGHRGTYTWPPSGATIHTLMGEQFQVMSAIPTGDAVRPAAGSPIWCVDQETLAFLQADGGPLLLARVERLRKAREAGETVVRGIVMRNPRRPDPAPRVRRANLDDLQARVRGLITQIAEMLDRGPIPDAQMGELSSATARLQAEYDDVCRELEDIDAQLAMARGLIVAYHLDPSDEESE